MDGATDCAVFDRWALAGTAGRWLSPHRSHTIATILRVLLFYLPMCLSGALCACGGGGDGGSGSSAASTGNPTYAISGTINGMIGTGLVLTDGSATVAPQAGAASFTFPTPLTTGTAYSVTVQTQPAGQTCSTASGSGTVGSANVTSVTVSCVTNASPASTYGIAGTISGLTGGGLILTDGTDVVSPAAGAGTFTFPTQLTTGTAYSVTVQTQPAGQTCSAASGSGTVGSANVTSVTVSCVPNAPPASTYAIAGTISGLTGAGLVLANAGGTVSPAASASSFTFPTQLTTGTAYSVTVQTQPAGQTCSAARGSGTVGSANITSVAITCVTNAAAGSSTSTAKILFRFPKTQAGWNQAMLSPAGSVIFPIYDPDYVSTDYSNRDPLIDTNIAAAQSLGLKIFAYIDGRNSEAASSAVEADITTWITQLAAVGEHVDGVFIGNAGNNTGVDGNQIGDGNTYANYWVDLIDWIHSTYGTGIPVFIHPGGANGTDSDTQQILTVAASVVMYESYFPYQASDGSINSSSNGTPSLSSVDPQLPQTWMPNYDRSRFCAMANGVLGPPSGSPDLANVESYFLGKNIGYLYVTDVDNGATDDPGYWSQELAALSQVP